jgi:hypothetical protein
MRCLRIVYALASLRKMTDFVEIMRQQRLLQSALTSATLELKDEALVEAKKTRNARRKAKYAALAPAEKPDSTEKAVRGRWTVVFPHTRDINAYRMLGIEDMIQYRWVADNPHGLPMQQRDFGFSCLGHLVHLKDLVVNCGRRVDVKFLLSAALLVATDQPVPGLLSKFEIEGTVEPTEDPMYPNGTVTLPLTVSKGGSPQVRYSLEIFENLLQVACLRFSAGAGADETISWLKESYGSMSVPASEAVSPGGLSGDANPSPSWCTSECKEDDPSQAQWDNEVPAEAPAIGYGFNDDGGWGPKEPEVEHPLGDGVLRIREEVVLSPR